MQRVGKEQGMAGKVEGLYPQKMQDWDQRRWGKGRRKKLSELVHVCERGLSVQWHRATDVTAQHSCEERTGTVC